MSATQQQQFVLQQRNLIARWLSVAALTLVIAAEALAAPTIEAFPAATNLVTNGPVLASASFGSNSGEATGHGIGLDVATALIDPRFPKVEKSGGGRVLTIIDDGFGGWVIGGDFDTVGGVTLTNLAHINADFSVNGDWQPNPNGVVRAVLFHTGDKGLRLLVGGDFTQIHGEPRSYFAELHTGSISKPVTSLDLNIDAPVRSIVSDELIYIGGDFTLVQGTGPRDDDGDGQLDVDINGAVTVDMDGDGIFETAMTIIGDAINDIDVDGDGDIDIDVTGDGIVDVGINVNYALSDPPLDTPYDQTYPSVTDERQRLAALDLDETSNGMVVSAWNPNVDGRVEVMVLAVERGVLYIGGEFSNISVDVATGTADDVARKSIAALVVNNNINIITTWNPGDTTDTTSINAMSLVEFIVDGSTGAETGRLYVGGNFTKIGGQTRNNFAELNIALAVNNATSWDLDFNAPVHALEQTDEAIIVGGEFTQVDGDSNFQYLTAVSRVDGTVLTSWNPMNINGMVNALTINEETLYVGGEFTSIADESRLYIGGDFTYIGPSTGSGVIVSPATGAVQTGWPEVNGDIYVAIPDGSNGWYIGGSFSQVGASLRNNIARINSNQTVNSWNPNVNGAVRALARSGADLYVGGDFDEIGGAIRNYLALIDGAGAATSWNPNANGTVRALAVRGADLYVGGDFTNFSAGARNRLAKFNGSGVLQSWNPDADGSVRALSVDSLGQLYVGGDFTSFTAGIDVRNRIALFNSSDVLQAWDPNADGTVRVLEINTTNDDLYVGGDFTSFSAGADIRNRIALFNSSGALQAWNPNANGAVSELLQEGGTLYVGGDFTFIGSLLRNRAAAFTLGSDVSTAWDPAVGHTVHALAPGAGTVFIGGAFASVGGVTRERLAAIDSSSGVLDPTFEVGTNATVRTMTLSGDGSTLYVGGDFTSVGGQTRNHLAALNTVTGAATVWNPNIEGASPTTTVHDMELTAAGNLLYIGGEFETIGGDARNNIGALDITNSVHTGWDPSADGTVHAVELSGDTVLIGGDFHNLNTNGQNVARLRLAALETRSSTNNATLWAPAVNDVVREMEVSGSTLYIGGDFTNINDSGVTRSRNRLAALDITANAFNVLNWNPNANGSVHAVALTDDAIFVGGDFTTVNGIARERLAALDFVDGTPLNWWDLRADATVSHLGISGIGDRMVVAGDFRQITTTVPTAMNLRRGLTVVDVGFPHVVINPPAGAYSTPLISPSGAAMSCIDTPKNCAQPVYYTVNSAASPVVGLSDSLTPIDISINTTLKVVTVDDAGNQSEIQTALYVIDSQPPETTATPAGPLPDGRILSSNDELEITLTCVDNGEAGCAETYYTLDGTTPTDSSAVYLEPITIGENTTLKYISFDQARNDETSAGGVNEEIYKVDLSGPTVVADPPTQVFFTEQLTVTLLCSDDPSVNTASIGDIPDASNPPSPDDPPGTGVINDEDERNRTITGCSGVYYTLDDSTPSVNSTLYTGPISFSDSTIIKYIAIDRAGNDSIVQRASYVKNYSDNAGAAGPLGLGLLLLPWLCWRVRSHRALGAAHKRGWV